MKQLEGSARAAVVAPLPACFALLEAVERYSEWYPEVVRSVQVVERAEQGHATRARTRLHLSYGPLVKDFDLLFAITTDRPRAVELTRIAHGPSDRERFEVRWRLHGDGRTLVELALEATLDVPRLLPLGGIGDSIANGFVTAATRELAST